jgi:pyruvate dehydrogenase E2 component (dihydrolipoamide acetyltransferase)
MPALGADMEAGILAEWLVKPGDKIEAGDVVCVVETQKGAIEVEIFETGTIAELLVHVGEEVPVGASLARLGDGAAHGEPPPTPAPAHEPVLAGGGAPQPHLEPAPDQHPKSIGGRLDDAAIGGGRVLTACWMRRTKPWLMALALRRLKRKTNSPR